MCPYFESYRFYLYLVHHSRKKWSLEHRAFDCEQPWSLNPKDFRQEPTQCFEMRLSYMISDVSPKEVGLYIFKGKAAEWVPMRQPVSW